MSVKWTRKTPIGVDGLASADDRFVIARRVDYILGTRCVSFVLYDQGAKVTGHVSQAEAKRIANERAATGGPR